MSLAEIIATYRQELLRLAWVYMVTREPFSTLVRRRHLVVSDNHGRSVPTRIRGVDRIANSGDFGKLTMISDTRPNFTTYLVFRRFIDDCFGLIPACAFQVLLFAIVAPAFSTVKVIVFHVEIIP